MERDTALADAGEAHALHVWAEVERDWVTGEMFDLRAEHQRQVADLRGEREAVQVDPGGSSGQYRLSTAGHSRTWAGY